jgi:DNA processing protein
VDVRNAVTLSLLPRSSCLRQQGASGATSWLSEICAALHACHRTGMASDAVFEEVLAVLQPAVDARASLRALRARVEKIIQDGARAGLDPLPLGHALFPSLLAEIYDPPPVLWLKGRRSALEGLAVAIVGSRAASPYALEVAKHLGTELARRGVTVVSGLARGVDSAAHRGALAAGGPTVAVLGCGADLVYPWEHRTLAEDISAVGVLVSELPAGTPPRPRHFPRRNRIISGLSRAVVVVEASERSGSLITAACALEQGREVMAVPGNVLSGRNRGSHALLKDGAKIVESADDILEELGRADDPTGGSAAADAQKDPLLHAMAPGEAYDLDTLAVQTGLGGGALLSRLAELELSGRIRRADGGRFVREQPSVL